MKVLPYWLHRLVMGVGEAAESGYGKIKMEYDNTNSGYLVKRGGWRGQTRDGKPIIKIRIKPKLADNTWSGSAKNRMAKAETADVL